ncbi:GNAT family N-acetyltransferase [Actinokineospora enzanensis]|uniref:GNAT family N-acetyltransferase n=1 Tax=Actinokineospora enzanensis TaxID=155975 RepID=UPI000362F03F|nr:GNAT family N-acetyltransferase [Actinokineospora enzanensis]
MRVRSTTDIDRFRAEVGPWLLRKPVENNVLLYHTYDPSGALPGDSPAHPRWVVDSTDEVVGAAWVHAPYRPTITDMPTPAALALAEELAKQETWLPGVNGPTEAATAFAGRWAEVTGRTAKRERDQWLMVCTNANRIPQIPGSPRLGRADEVDQVATWFSTTMRDSGMSPDDILRYMHHMVADQVEGTRLILWEDKDTIVGAAGRARPIGGVVRPSGVFVHPDHRSGGYAAALLGETTARALEDGADACTCIHYLEYAQMQAVVEKVGYHHVQDLTEYRFA